MMHDLDMYPHNGQDNGEEKPDPVGLVALLIIIIIACVGMYLLIN